MGKMYMVKKDVELIHNKLDKLIVLTAKLEEHQRSINGSIVRLQSEANNRVVVCGRQFENLQGKISVAENNIVFARGSVYALTLISMILGIILVLKTFNLF
jgi:hypothetical protein